MLTNSPATVQLPAEVGILFARLFRSTDVNELAQCKRRATAVAASMRVGTLLVGVVGPAILGGLLLEEWLPHPATRMDAAINEMSRTGTVCQSSASAP
jgi:predicted MFS family arabinose efflux permease